MGMGRTSLSIALAGSLAACGGGGSGSGGGTPVAVAPTPTPTQTTSECSLSARQDFAKSVIDEWYLFPALVDNSVNKASHSSVQSYIDALVAPARAQSKDRFFTYITSIAEEDAFFNSGSSAGFGIRLASDTVNDRVFVVESFEHAPGLAAGIDRGSEILAIGSASVSSLMATGGAQAVVNAMGPSDPGVSRTFQVRTNGVVSNITLTKVEFELDPVSNRYGAKIIDDGGKKVGYVNMRTFIGTADSDLRSAFAEFRAQGVTELIVDLRYNGGGLVSIAELMGDLMGRDKVGKVFSYTTLRPSKAAENETDLFGAQPEAIAPTRVAFIGFGGTASASELVINAMLPYLGNSMALVGGNTFGKPVGQFAFDKPACDDRLRVIAFKTENANHQGEYFTGLASVVPQTCKATDDISVQLGEPGEASIATALDFLAGRACTPIASGGQGALGQAKTQLLEPEKPTAAQHEVPGLF